MSTYVTTENSPREIGERRAVRFVVNSGFRARGARRLSPYFLIVVWVVVVFGFERVGERQAVCPGVFNLKISGITLCIMGIRESKFI